MLFTPWMQLINRVKMKPDPENGMIVWYRRGAEAENEA